MQLLGTLLRCAGIDERRIAYYHEIGLNALQIAGVYEDWLAPTDDARRASDAKTALAPSLAILEKAAPDLAALL